MSLEVAVMSVFGILVGVSVLSIINVEFCMMSIMSFPIWSFVVFECHDLE